MELKSSLVEYSNITKILIEKTKQGEEIEVLLDEREKIIQGISNLKFSKDEFEDIVINLKIFELEKEFQNQIKIEQVKIKNKIETIKKSTIARRRYNDLQFKPTFFNKKI